MIDELYFCTDSRKLYEVRTDHLLQATVKFSDGYTIYLASAEMGVKPKKGVSYEFIDF